MHLQAHDLVQRAPNGRNVSFAHMGVNLRCFGTLVAEEFLDAPNVCASFHKYALLRCHRVCTVTCFAIPALDRPVPEPSGPSAPSEHKRRHCIDLWEAIRQEGGLSFDGAYFEEFVV